MVSQKELSRILNAIANTNVGELSNNEYENDIYAILDLFEAYVVSKSEEIQTEGINNLNRKVLNKWSSQINSIMKNIKESELKKNKFLYKRYSNYRNFCNLMR